MCLSSLSKCTRHWTEPGAARKLNNARGMLPRRSLALALPPTPRVCARIQVGGLGCLDIPLHVDMHISNLLDRHADVHSVVIILAYFRHIDSIRPSNPMKPRRFFTQKFYSTETPSPSINWHPHKYLAEGASKHLLV